MAAPVMSRQTLGTPLLSLRCPKVSCGSLALRTDKAVCPIGRSGNGQLRTADKFLCAGLLCHDPLGRDRFGPALHLLHLLVGRLDGFRIIDLARLALITFRQRFLEGERDPLLVLACLGRPLHIQHRVLGNGLQGFQQFIEQTLFGFAVVAKRQGKSFDQRLQMFQGISRSRAPGLH